MIRFALLVGEHARDFVVIGGLNPDLLAPEAPVPHQGTTDVDLLFALGFDDVDEASDFAWIDEALAEGGFTSANKWRWDAVLGDAHVRFEFLCDVWDHTADTVPLPGSNAVASKIAGPGAALALPIDRELPVSRAIHADHADAPESVTLRFANLGGYLLAKAAAAVERTLAKDKYDLMYVILYNDGGADAAASAVAFQLDAVGDTASADHIRDAMKRFLDPSGMWAGRFASSMILAGDSAPEEQLRTDAAMGARTFLDRLDTLGV
ncbi:MAG: hypothetical protein J7484_03715 [Microbacterium sp.]|nr:hypothetical protein [Microbacterium sp.]